MFRFASPWLLLIALLAPLPAIASLLRTRRRAVGRLLYSETVPLAGAGESARTRLARIRPWGQGVALALGAVALARPQSGHRIEQVTTEGVDIVVALDVSGSMRAEDFSPKNRLFVARKTIEGFIAGRSGDRIGLVTFASAAQTLCPPTLDYDALRASLGGATFADARDDGTAIGTGIATAVNRLRTSKAKSRLVILLTDGINNAGAIDPVTAADLARAVGVRIHAVGVGSNGPVEVPLPDGRRIRIELPIDEDGLRKIAGSTGGSYFRATDARALEEIFRKIDAMEKTRMEVTHYGHYEELFAWFLAPTLLVLAADFAAGATLLARVP